MTSESGRFIVRSAFWLTGQFVVRMPMYEHVPTTVFWRDVSLLPSLQCAPRVLSP